MEKSNIRKIENFLKANKLQNLVKKQVDVEAAVL